uniref:Major facilitator superfamily (MFS) profile domain-containing protein n=1 Tax=Tetranychus urticae TaxID=32264 RepID=T1KC47_TETUR
MDRSRGDSGASIKSVINKVARFRWLIFILGNIANLVIFIVLNSFSLTIVGMIGKHEEQIISLAPVNSSFNASSSSVVSPRSVHVDWSNVDKSRMLSASFWGSLVMSLFGGRICELFGPRKVVSLSLLVNGIVTLLFPVISIHSFIGAYVIRIVSGSCTGIVQPSCIVIVSRWSMVSERTLANAVVSSGNAFSNLISLPLAGILVDSSFLGGWPSVFYLFGGLNLIVAIIWFIVVYDTPEVHPYLGSEELEVILKNRSVSSGGSVKVPWCKMFTSIPIIAYLIPAFTYGWVVAVVTSQVPSFYEDILDFSYTGGEARVYSLSYHRARVNGFVTSLPWLVGIGAQLIGSAVTDRIRKANRFSLASIRKIVTVLCNCSIGLVAITMLGKHRIPVVLTLALAKGMGTLSVAGSGVNHLDIAPSFAGTLAGFYGVMLSLASLIANEAAAHIVGKNSSQQNWYHYFYISSAVNIAGVILFCLLGSGEIQSWDPASSTNRRNVKSKTRSNDLELLSVEH